ncbi:MAG: PIN domain-containing protein [Actinobacteria bacterium]|nr:PIN domain-containing protein [Actinomycetota bacterium]
MPRSETLICDTSFFSHMWRRLRTPARYEHWDAETIDRIETAILSISVVTIAETRAGYLRANWGSSMIEAAERHLRCFHPIPVRRRYVGEWARLRDAARSAGIAISDNDLWIAATASRREQILVTCDRDHVRIARDLPVEVVYLAPPV